jgi:membrane protein required for colicin V production
MITLLDIVLLAVMLISALLAAARGLIRVILSIACCGAAAGVTILSYSVPLSFAKQYFNENVALALVIHVIFLSSLIVILVAVARLSHAILDPRINLLDGTLGFLFGLSRGLIILTVVFLFFAWLIPERAQPDWIRNAKSLAVLKGTGVWLMSMLPDVSDNKFASQLFGSILGLTLTAIPVDFCAIIVRLAGYQVPTRNSAEKTDDGDTPSGYTQAASWTRRDSGRMPANRQP